LFILYRFYPYCGPPHNSSYTVPPKSPHIKKLYINHNSSTPYTPQSITTIQAGQTTYSLKIRSRLGLTIT
jgi:hypothetical protein